MGQMAELTTSSGSLGSSWTGTLTRGSPPSPPKCGREKKASQREILSGKPASSGGGNPQRHLPRAAHLVHSAPPALRWRMLIGCRPGTGRGAARYQAALGPPRPQAGPRPHRAARVAQAFPGLRPSPGPGASTTTAAQHVVAGRENVSPKGGRASERRGSSGGKNVRDAAR